MHHARLCRKEQGHSDRLRLKCEGGKSSHCAIKEIVFGIIRTEKKSLKYCLLFYDFDFFKVNFYSFFIYNFTKLTTMAIYL